MSSNKKKSAGTAKKSKSRRVKSSPKRRGSKASGAGTKKTASSKMDIVPLDSKNKMTSIASSYFDDAYVNVGKFATQVAPAADDYKVGTRVVGCDSLCSVGDIKGNNNIFQGYVPGYGNSADTITGHPINFPRLANMALNFSKFIFREICIEYTPFVGSNTNGAFGIGVDSSGSIGSGIGLMTELASYLHSFITPWWKPACTVIKFFQKNLYFTDWDSDTSTPSQKLNAQFCILGYNSNGTPGATDINGMLCVRYVCDFYGPNPPNSALSLYGLSILKSLKRVDQRHVDSVFNYAAAVKRSLEDKKKEKPDSPRNAPLLVGRGKREVSPINDFEYIETKSKDISLETPRYSSTSSLPGSGRQSRVG